MAALGAPTMIAQSGPKTAIKISNHICGCNFIITKILFIGKSKYKKSQWITNLCLASRALRGEPENEWAALGAAHEKVGKIPESQIMEYIYDFARTHFIRNI